MRPFSFIAVSCFNGLAAAFAKDGLTAALEKGRCVAARRRNGLTSPQCVECERLEAEFFESRDRLRTLARLHGALEEKQLIDRVAIAIARIKEHEARHDCDRCKKGLAVKYSKW